VIGANGAGKSTRCAQHLRRAAAIGGASFDGVAVEVWRRRT
jgi:ABC-type cobalamin transport system ATPase subunit